MRWMGHEASVGERRGLYRILERKPERKIQLGGPRHRWKDNINPYPANVEYMVSS